MQYSLVKWSYDRIRQACGQREQGGTLVITIPIQSCIQRLVNYSTQSHSKYSLVPMQALSLWFPDGILKLISRAKSKRGAPGFHGLVPRPFLPPVFHHLQYANMEGERPGRLAVTSGRQMTDTRGAVPNSNNSHFVSNRPWCCE